MITKIFLHRLMIGVFIVGLGFVLAKAVYAESKWGIALAIISLLAACYFIYLYERKEFE